MSRTPPDDGGISSPDLDAVIRAMPIGMRVIGDDGSVAFSHDGIGDLAEQFVSRQVYSANVAGAGFAVELTLDDREAATRQQELVRKAYFDDLTQLPNRALMERSVATLIASEDCQPFALAFFDLDGFKSVNDFYGHDAGDDLLVAISQRLQSALRPGDMVARLSGDEFALLLSPVTDAESVMREVEWLCQRVKEPVFADGNEILTSASIGVCIYPDHGESFEELRANADRAMYRAKGLLKGTVQLFDSSIQHNAAEKARSERRLRMAIRDRRVCCAYQPKVEIGTGKVLGVEVLMRWRDEDGIIQPPGEFLELAIELGLMDDLTRFILDESISQIDQINEAFGPDCSISINIAAKQAGDAKFMRSLLNVVAESGFAKRFMLELTEEAFLSRKEFQERILPMIREVGAKVSIDDFGVGYSSLSALAGITADELKVDRSFITEVHRRPRSQAVLKAIEALGQSLGMSIVVEGVETFEELAYLQAATRIRCAQGYYYSPPMMLSEYREAKRVEKLEEARPQSTARTLQLSRTAG
ncbi:MAG: EAL domain-containing protein [Mesorhizobium sp.]